MGDGAEWGEDGSRLLPARRLPDVCGRGHGVDDAVPTGKMVTVHPKIQRSSQAAQLRKLHLDSIVAWKPPLVQAVKRAMLGLPSWKGASPNCKRKSVICRHA